MSDISGFGLVVTLKASNTYPIGIIINQFADDADPFDIPDIQIAETSMGLNGDLVSFAKATPLEVSLSVIPDGVSDLALSALVEANRVARGKTSAADQITLVGVYPSGAIKRFTNGRLVMGPVASSVSSAGRLKSKTYKFSFENKGGI